MRPPIGGIIKGLPFEEGHSYDELCAALWPGEWRAAAERMLRKVPASKRRGALRPVWSEHKAKVFRDLRKHVCIHDAKMFADAAARYCQHFGDLHGDRSIVEGGCVSIWTTAGTGGLNFGLFSPVQLH